MVAQPLWSTGERSDALSGAGGRLGMIKNRKRGEPYRLFWVECAISLNQAQGARDRDFDEKIKITDKTNGYKIFGDCPEGE